VNQTNASPTLSNGPDRTPGERQSGVIGLFALSFLLAIAGATWLWFNGAKGHQSHPSITWPEAIVQMAVSVAICLTWFLGFRAARQTHAVNESQSLPALTRPFHRLSRTPWQFLLLLSAPALLFAVAMREQYNPAVFVMALAAIFVAAEHYSSIAEAKDDIARANGELTSTVSLLTATKQELTENRKSIDMLLNDDGLPKWKGHVYKDYLAATDRIDAVIRIFDIDDTWWQLDGDWDQYKASNDDDNPTLFHALTSPGAGKVRTDCVQFVAELPVPDIAGAPVESAQAEAFESLFGLTWWLVVLEHVRRARALAMPPTSASTPGPRPFIAIRMASSPSWMHAIDDKVYQVIERPEPYPATVRSLSGAFRTPSQNQRLRQWAHDDVRHTARRGCDGEEYLCAVLRLVGLASAGVAESNPLTADYLTPILKKLGMVAWLDKKHARSDRERRERLCVQVFLSFAHQRVALNGRPQTIRGLLGDLI
jgi:hypothetical protein